MALQSVPQTRQSASRLYLKFNESNPFLEYMCLRSILILAFDLPLSRNLDYQVLSLKCRILSFLISAVVPHVSRTSTVLILATRYCVSSTTDSCSLCRLYCGNINFSLHYISLVLDKTLTTLCHLVMGIAWTTSKMNAATSSETMVTNYQPKVPP
jgi:uncharacterized membrane protein